MRRSEREKEKSVKVILCICFFSKHIPKIWKQIQNIKIFVYVFQTSQLSVKHSTINSHQVTSLKWSSHSINQDVKSHHSKWQVIWRLKRIAIWRLIRLMIWRLIWLACRTRIRNANALANNLGLGFDKLTIFPLRRN